MQRNQRFISPLLLAVALLMPALLPAPAQAAPPATRSIAVTVADKENLQHAPFWIALYGGFFAKRGITVKPAALGRPRELLQANGPAWEAAILPPPIFLQLIADDGSGDRVRLAATLMRGDPLTLIVRKAIADGLPPLDPKADLATRLRALTGRKVAVAPGPLSRLRALWASAKVPLDESKQLQIVAGPDQNATLHAGTIDALLAHTPYVERALLAGDATAWFTIGDKPLPPLGVREGHALVVKKALVDADPQLVLDMVKSLDDARAWLKTHRAEAAALLAKQWPDRPTAELDLGLTLLESTWPSSSDPSVDGLLNELALFPASQQRPTLSREQLARAVWARGKRP